MSRCIIYLIRTSPTPVTMPVLAINTGNSGIYRLRGYPPGRFSDKASVYYSAELRFIPRNQLILLAVARAGTSGDQAG
jgi:hypothetical protein